MKKRFVLTTLISAFLTFFPKTSYAQPSCQEVKSQPNIPIGTSCVHRVYVDTGYADWPNGRESGTTTYTPTQRYWVITHVSPPKESNASRTSRANIQTIAGGQLSSVQREISNSYNSMQEAYDRLRSEATVPIEGVPVNIENELENLQRRINEIENASRYATNVQSNVGQVILNAEAWGRCSADIPLAGCVDGTGGWYEGYVEVTEIFVGDIADLEQEFNRQAQEAFQLISQSQRSNSSSSTSSGEINIQRSGTLQTGDSVMSSDDSLFDVYNFSGSAGQTVEISLSSTDFDSYLILVNSAGEFLEENDDASNTTRDSLIRVTLPTTGDYQVYANSYDATGRGNYNLTIRSVN